MLPETWATALVFAVGCRQAASPKSKRRHHDKKDNGYSDCICPVMISEPEQVNDSHKHQERRCRKAAAIKVPGEEAIHKTVEAFISSWVVLRGL